MEFKISFSRKKKEPILSEKDNKWLQFSRAVGINTPNELWNFLNPTNESTKNTVTKENALTLSAVYQAINIHANSLNLPITVKKKGENGEVMNVTPSDRYEYQVNYLLKVSPNQFQTPAEWISLMETSRLMYGNGYSYIVRSGSGFPTALKWLHPDQVEIIPDNIRNYYKVKDLITGKIIYPKVPAWDMIHVKSLNGVSVIEYGAASMGLGLSTQNTSKKFFDDGMSNKVVLSHPGSLKQIAQENLSKSFSEQMKNKSTLVLEEGLKPYLLTIPPQQAEMILNKEFSVTDVARWFNLPEHMLNNLKTSTNNNIEFQGLQFTTHNVRPRVRIYEQEFNWKLLGNVPEFYTVINMDGLLRADLLTRFNAYAIGIQNRFMNPNEARFLENMNPYEGGDIYENPNITPGTTDGSNNDNK